jgi:hypothetical protein
VRAVWVVEADAKPLTENPTSSAELDGSPAIVPDVYEVVVPDEVFVMLMVPAVGAAMDVTARSP